MVSAVETICMKHQNLFSGNIRLHHECPCRIGKSHQRVVISTRDEACWVPGWNSYPKDEISLSYMDWFMMDSFSPPLSGLFLGPAGMVTVMRDRSISHGQKASYRQRWEKNKTNISKCSTQSTTKALRSCMEYCNCTVKPPYNSHLKKKKKKSTTTKNWLL